MIVRVNDTRGKAMYFNFFTGKRYIPYRETGRKEGRLPDVARRFLTPGRRTNSPENYIPDPTRQQRREAQRGITITQQPGWLSRLWSWFKSLWHGSE